MTVPEIIGDAQACECAKRLMPRILGARSVDLRFLVRDGRIGRGLVALSAEVRDDDLHSPDFVALLRYVAFHGERGPQADWQAGRGTPCPTCGDEGTVCCGERLDDGRCCETLDGGDIGRPCPDCSERGRD